MSKFRPNLAGTTAGTFDIGRRATFSVAGVTTPYTWTLPPANAAGVLTNDGLGALSWGVAGTAAAPRYEAIVAAAGQVVINTALPTLAGTGGRTYLQVFVNGVLQQEGLNKRFVVSGANQITFNAGLRLNDDVAIFGYA